MSIDLLAVCRSIEVEPIQEGDWRNHKAGTFWVPTGVIIHHTAGINDMHVVRDGRPRVPGPLSNFWIGQNGDVHLISNSKTNNAGRGMLTVLNRTRRDLAPEGNATSSGTIVGNFAYYGFEMEGGRFHGDFTPAQLDVTHRIAHALCAAHGWSPNRIIRHREWTSRKIDPSTPYPFRDPPEDDMPRAHLSEDALLAACVNGIFRRPNGQPMNSGQIEEFVAYWTTAPEDEWVSDLWPAFDNGIALYSGQGPPGPPGPPGTVPIHKHHFSGTTEAI